MLLTGEISPVSVVKAFEDERKLKSSNNYFAAYCTFGLSLAAPTAIVLFGLLRPVKGQTSNSKASGEDRMQIIRIDSNA